LRQIAIHILLHAWILVCLLQIVHHGLIFVLTTEHLFFSIVHFLTIQLLPKFGFGYQTSKPNIFCHPTIKNSSNLISGLFWWVLLNFLFTI
jgi:hypothetical protein